MSSNPPSPATSELRLEMTPTELEETLRGTKRVLEDEENYIPLIIGDTISLSWPRVARMGESLREVSTGTLEELIRRYPDEPAVGLWTAIIASRSYKTVSALLEVRTAALQSCWIPETAIQILEASVCPEEAKVEAKKMVHCFFAEVDCYRGPLVQTLGEATTLLSAYKKKVKLVFRESVATLKELEYWE